ncbi:MAG: hypothetical protein KF796_20620 [Ramlibacter sp.]|nr:hypothetical protein [Ramlibacter sp.]
MRRKICGVCKKPVLPGQAYNGATKNHWDCDPARSPRAAMEDFGKALERTQQAMNGLAARLKKSRGKK